MAPRGYRNSRDVLNKPIIVPDKEGAKAVKHVSRTGRGWRAQSQLIHEANDMGTKLSRNGISQMLETPCTAARFLVPAEDDEPEMLIDGKHKALSLNLCSTACKPSCLSERPDLKSGRTGN